MQVNPILTFINVLLQLLSFAIIVRVILSWLNIDKSGGFVLFIRDVTEPVMEFFRKITPRIGMIDISPIIAIVAIDLAIKIINSLMN